MASVQEKKNKWYFVIYNSETKKHKWVPSDIEVDKTNKRNYERSKAKAERALALWELEEEERKEREAEEARIAQEAAKKILFADFIEQWLDHHEGDVNNRTLESYRSACNNHIIPYFSEKGVYLQEVKPADMQGYFDLKKKTLSVTTLKKHKAYLSATFKYARLLELIKYNPLENVALGKQKGSKYVADWYDDDETAEVIRLARKIDEPITAAIYLSSMLGLRREECCGMSWENVNWKKKTIKVRETVVKESGTFKIVNTVKTDTSYRELPLSDNDIVFLKAVKKRQELNKKLYGNAYTHEYDGYICLWGDGRLITPDTITRRWKSFIERNKLKKIRFQDLRASFGTNMLRTGATPERVARLMGHADPTTLLKYYARFCDEDLVKLVEKRSQNVAI